MKPNYLTDFKCTYLLHDIQDQEDMYRIQFLQIFKIKNWNDKIINSTIENLFNYINDIFKYNSESLVLHDCHINNILDKIKVSNKLQNIIMFCGDNDKLTNFKILLSFDYFQYIHSYFCELIKDSDLTINSILLMGIIKEQLRIVILSFFSMFLKT